MKDYLEFYAIKIHERLMPSKPWQVPFQDPRRFQTEKEALDFMELEKRIGGLPECAEVVKVIKTEEHEVNS